jgi:hypothetical protein
MKKVVLLLVFVCYGAVAFSQLKVTGDETNDFNKIGGVCI